MGILRYKSLLILLVSCGLSIVVYQNCAPSKESGSSTLPGEDPPVDPLDIDICTVKNASGETVFETEVSTLSDCKLKCESEQDLDSSISCFFGEDDISGDFSSCEIRGGAGVELISLPDPISNAQCETTCEQFSTSNPNRSCLWDGVDLAPVDSCIVTGGAGAELLPSTNLTRGHCFNACEEYLETNPNRSCRWGDDELAQTGSCDIKGGAGVQLTPIKTLTRGECFLACNGFEQTNPNRVCLWDELNITSPL